jgi:hypothetical protein
MRWERHVVRSGKNRNTFKVLMCKYEGKRSLGRPGCRWDNNAMNVKENVWEIVE